MKIKQHFFRFNRSGRVIKLLPFVLCFALFSCKKGNEPPVYDLGYSYFPLDSGFTWLYWVDSISYNDNTQKTDTFHFMLKERIGGLVLDQSLKNHFILERNVRKNDTSNWEPRSNGYLYRTGNTLQRVEENTRIVKLLFPIGNVLNWNGNMYNNSGWKSFSMQSIGSNFNNGDTLFSNTLTVQEDLANNAIEEILIKSVYAKEVGLVDFTHTNINTQVNGKSGYKVRQKLISFIKP